MRRFQTWVSLSLFVLLLMGGWQTAGAQNATAILEKAAAAYERSNGISASFVLLTKTPSDSGEGLEGTIQMKGEKFTLVTPDVLTWYDGTTQWSYVARNEEVNVSNPSGKELQFTNPALLLSNYDKGFMASLKGESTAANGKAVYDIELVPKKKSDIIRVELQIEKFSSWPTRIAVFAKNGVSSTIRISEIKAGVNQPDGVFVFNEADFPDAEVIDLR